MAATLKCTQGEDTCFSERRDGEKERNDIGRGVGNPLCIILRVRPFASSASSNALFIDYKEGIKR